MAACAVCVHGSRGVHSFAAVETAGVTRLEWNADAARYSAFESQDGAALFRPYRNAIAAIPNPLSIKRGYGPSAFAITAPSESDWLDVWGTMWKPQFGKGGRI